MFLWNVSIHLARLQGHNSEDHWLINNNNNNNKELNRIELNYYINTSQLRCWKEVSGHPLPLWPQRNKPWYPFCKRPDERQSRSGLYGQEKNLLPLPGTEPRFIAHLFRSLVSIPTELSRLCVCMYVGLYMCTNVRDMYLYTRFIFRFAFQLCNVCDVTRWRYNLIRRTIRCYATADR
jgi:hypothetical protein